VISLLSTYNPLGQLLGKACSLALVSGLELLVVGQSDHGLSPSAVLEGSQIPNGLDAELLEDLASGIRKPLESVNGSLDEFLEALGLVGLVHGVVDVHGRTVGAIAFGSGKADHSLGHLVELVGGKFLDGVDLESIQDLGRDRSNALQCRHGGIRNLGEGLSFVGLDERFGAVELVILPVGRIGGLGLLGRRFARHLATRIEDDRYELDMEKIQKRYDKFCLLKQRMSEENMKTKNYPDIQLLCIPQERLSLGRIGPKFHHDFSVDCLSARSSFCRASLSRSCQCSPFFKSTSICLIDMSRVFIVITEGADDSPGHHRGIYRLEVPDRNSIALEDESVRSVSDCEAMLRSTLQTYRKFQIVGTQFPFFDYNANL